MRRRAAVRPVSTPAQDPALVPARWFGHTGADFLTHVDDVRPLLWPITDWTWPSPVSYYNSAYYGREFFAISRALPCLIMAALLVRRLRRRRKEAASSDEGL